MNRLIEYLNLFGIIALAVLCAAQWQTNGQLNHDVERLDQMRIEQTAKIAEQDATLKQTSSDLDDSRQRLSISESALKDAEVKLAVAAAERDQLKANLAKWTAALAARDDAIRKLSAERNDAIQKFNDLANKYNALVPGSSGGK
jgi:septal ring factor EnvC (AmiA/AmiB activator)